MLIPIEECRDDVVKYRRRTSVEFIVGTKCQNACKYCYRVSCQNDGELLGTTVERMRMMYENAIDMGMIDRGTGIEIFGGDPITDYSFFKSVVEHFRDDTTQFLVPTNGRIIENIKDAEIDALIEASGNKLSLSLSVDGPQDMNRPMSQFGHMSGVPEERNWDRLFSLAKKYHWGFHPMLHFPTASLWFDTWKWFFDHDAHVYLLEVRHPIDDPKNIVEGVYQLAKIILTCEKMNIKPAFNTTSPSRTPRGLGCSALTSLCINTDGRVYFCHRLMQERYLIADLVTKQVDMRKYVMLGAGYDFKNSATCMRCPIKKYCMTVCVGAADEYWQGAVSLPIPSTCKYALLKLFYLINRTNTWGAIRPSIDLDHTKCILQAAFPNFNDVIADLDGRLKTDGLL